MVSRSIIVILIFVLTACGQKKSLLKFSIASSRENSQQEAQTSQSDPGWEHVKKTLFEPNCIKCHNPETAKIKKRVDLTQKGVVLENADEILFRMTDAFDQGYDYMPPKGNSVDLNLVKEFKSWRGDVKFSNLQKKLFEVSCLKCHGDKQSKHLNLTSKEVVIENFESIVYSMTKAFDENNKPMPPKNKGERVSEELLKEFAEWKNNL